MHILILDGITILSECLNKWAFRQQQQIRILFEHQTDVHFVYESGVQRMCCICIEQPLDDTEC